MARYTRIISCRPCCNLYVQMVRLMICSLFIVICTVITVDAIKCYVGDGANTTVVECTGLTGSCLKTVTSNGGRL